MNKSTVVAAIGAGMFVIILTAGIAINGYREALGRVARAPNSYTAFLVRDNMVGANNGVYVRDNATGQLSSRAFNDPRFIEMDPTNPRQMYVLETASMFVGGPIFYQFVLLGLPSLNVIRTTPWTPVVQISYEEETVTTYPLDVEITPDGNTILIAYYRDITTGSQTTRLMGTAFFDISPGPQYGGWSLPPGTTQVIPTNTVPAMGVAITRDGSKATTFGVAGSQNVFWAFFQATLPNIGSVSIPGVSTFYDIQANNSKAYVYYFDANQSGSSRVQSIDLSTGTLSFLSNLSIPALPTMRHDLELNVSQNRLIASGQGSTAVDTVSDTILCTDGTFSGLDAYQAEFNGSSPVASLHSSPLPQGTSNGFLGLTNPSTCVPFQNGNMIGNLSYPGFGTLPIIPPPFIAAPLVNGIVDSYNNYFYSTAAGTPAGVAVYMVNLNSLGGATGPTITQLLMVPSATAYVVDMDTTNGLGIAPSRRDATY